MALAFLGLAWLARTEPRNDDPRLTLLRGAEGVITTSIALSPAGTTIATTDSKGRISLREGWDGWKLAKPLEFPGIARTAAFSPDERFLAAAGVEPGVMIWDLTHGRTPRALDIPIQRVKALAFSADSQNLAVTTDLNGEIVVWDMALGRVRRRLYGRFPSLCAAFTPDGRSLVTGEIEEKAVVVWDLESGAERLRLRRTSGPITSVAISPDGELFAITSPWDREVPVLQLSSGQSLRKLEGHAVGTNAVAFSPDGKTLATAGNDGMVRLWTVATGMQRASLNGQGLSLAGLAFSPDGRILIATGQDDHVRVWDLAAVGDADMAEQAPDRDGPATPVAH